MNFSIFYFCFLVLIKLSTAVYKENHLSTLGNRITVLRGNGHPNCPLTDLPLQLVTLINAAQIPLKTVFNKKEHEQRMIEMQAKEGDIRGHILGSGIGGPAAIFNLAPQQFARIKLTVNGKTRYVAQWSQIEKEIEKYVKEGKGSVNYRVDLLYKDEKSPCRPSQFNVYADYYNRTGDLVKNVVSGPLMNNRDLEEEGDPLLDNKPGLPLPGPPGLPKPGPKKPLPRLPKRFRTDF